MTQSPLGCLLILFRQLIVVANRNQIALESRSRISTFHHWQISHLHLNAKTPINRRHKGARSHKPLRLRDLFDTWWCFCLIGRRVYGGSSCNELTWAETLLVFPISYHHFISFTLHTHTCIVLAEALDLQMLFSTTRITNASVSWENCCSPAAIIAPAFSHEYSESE